MVKSSGLERKSKASQEIPSSSMADIAFLLLIFFMVSTVFQKDRNRDIDWSQAAATEKIDQKQRNIQNIWVEPNGDVFVNDLPIPMEEISDLIRPMYASNRELVVSIRSDRAAPYRFIDAVQQELVAAGLLRVVFATELEQDMTRERR